MGDGDCNTVGGISIHAPRGGSDSLLCYIGGLCTYFNPRSPRGERLLTALGEVKLIGYFNPRSPRGERLVSVAFV